MWKSILDVVNSLFRNDERINQLEKRVEQGDQKRVDMATQITSLYIELSRLAEREKFREERLQQALEFERKATELERLKLSSEHTKLENEQLRLELERERRQLPSATLNPSDESQS